MSKTIIRDSNTYNLVAARNAVQSFYPTGPYLYLRNEKPNKTKDNFLVENNNIRFI